MTAADESAVRDEPDRSRLRFELIFASIWLGVGLFVLPALIYGVGVGMLGPYGENQGLGSFYADFFGDLAQPAGRAWAIVLGPLVVISLVRAMFLGVKAESADADERADVHDGAGAAHNRLHRPPSRSTPPLSSEPPPRPASSSPAPHERVEPRVTFED